MHPLKRISLLLMTLGAVALLAAGCGDDATDENERAASTTPAAASEFVGITEDDLPEGFTADPSFTADGRQKQFVNIPGHYWKVLDRGFAIGLHFQTEEPFPWAKDEEKGELLYIVYAIPGTCGDGNYAEAVKSPDASAVGALPPGFDHWHGVVGGGSKDGHWYTHIAVRDFEFAGPPENPFEGDQIEGGSAGFLPVCDIT